MRAAQAWGATPEAAGEEEEPSVAATRAWTRVTSSPGTAPGASSATVPAANKAPRALLSAWGRTCWGAPAMPLALTSGSRDAAAAANTRPAHPAVVPAPRAWLARAAHARR